jgi:hypothetical protein
MGDENKYDGVGDPFKSLLKEAPYDKGTKSWTTLLRSFSGFPQDKHLHQEAMRFLSRYMQIFIFHYLKD